MTSDRWQEIDRLFHAALERHPEERAAFLDAACAGDMILRREVESLLGHEPAAGDFLEHPALQEAARQIATEITLLPADPQVPGYTILRTLGEGGMGIVYLAQQGAPIHRQVALKLIKHGMDTRQVIARFEAERQALALMHHPHIAAVFDAGTTGDGRPFFVMEYVEGVPITDFCDRHRLSTRARLELFVQVCAAVQHAHQKGVIHRDLKPSNVLVSDADGRPLPKIIDFGVARAIDRSLTGRTAFTEQGTMVGTPEYMSPEQAALSADIDTTTDVYSLGVLLYELLVGALPFDPKDLRAAGYDEMRRMIRESDPPKPSSRLTGGLQAADAAAVAVARQTDAGRLTRQLKGDLDWITLKALEKDRRQRYATVAAFAADVAHYLADEPIAARAPSAAYRLRKFTRRYRGAVLGAAAVLLALVAGLAASITQYVRAEGQRVEAERQRSRADRQRTAAEAAALEAATQRYAALRATDEANRLRTVATNEAASAINARSEAEYRAYTSTIAAADGELRLNLAAAARTRLLAVPNELRGWEWHHLFLKADTSLVTLSSSPGCDKYSSNNPIDATLVLQDGGAAIHLRRCATLDTWTGPGYRHTRRSFQADRPVRILAVAPSGHALVASGPADQAGNQAPWEARLVDPASNETVGVIGPFAAAPICADISTDGARIAVGLAPQISSRGEPLEDFFETWDARTGKRLARMSPPKPALFFDTRYISPVTCLVTFSPDGTLVASSGATVHVWKSASGVEVISDPAQAGYSRQPIAFNGDGSRLAIGRLTGLVDVLSLTPAPRLDSLDGSRFVRVPAQQPLADLERRNLVNARRKNEVLSLAFSPDGSRVISSTDGGVGIWDLREQKLVNVLAGHDAAVIAVGVARDGRLVSGDVSGTVRVWPADAFGAVTVLPGFGEHGGEIALSPDGSLVGIGQFDAGVSVWRLSDRQRIVLRSGTGRIGEPARPVVITPDRRHLLASTDYDVLGTVTWWGISSGDSTRVPLNAFPEPGCESGGPRPAGVTVMALTFDGLALAARQGNCVVVKDVPTKRTLATLREIPTVLMFLPDGSLLVRTRRALGTPSAPGSTVLIWDWRANRVRARVMAASKSANSQAQLTVSADGRKIAIAGGSPTTVSIWDGNLQRELGRLPVPPNTVSVAFSPDGRRVATTASDTTIRIWDADRYQLLLILSDEDAHLGGIAFTPDGRLIAGRSGGGLTIWETRKKQAPSPHP